MRQRDSSASIGSGTTAKHYAPIEWFEFRRAGEVVEAYNRGGGSSLEADAFVARSIFETTHRSRISLARALKNAMS